MRCSTRVAVWVGEPVRLGDIVEVGVAVPDEVAVELLVGVLVPGEGAVHLACLRLPGGLDEPNPTTL